MPEDADRPVYHLTHVDNLASILAAGGLLAYNCLQDRRPVSIAHRVIQDRRGVCRVGCGPGGVLHDYVPFYFASRSPMLYAIWRGNVAGYTDGQDRLIHLVTTPRTIVEADCAFVFTDGHAIMRLSAFYDRLTDLAEVDWPVMRSRMWQDTESDPDRKRRRQAEFLVHRQVPWPLIQRIGTRCEAIGDCVRELLAAQPHQPQVVVVPAWYYS